MGIPYGIEKEDAMQQGLKFFYLPQPDGGKYVQSLNAKSDYYDMLANYITGNIMTDKTTCEEILKSIADIESGKIIEDDLSGNVCFGTMTKSEVEIGMRIGDEITTAMYPLHLFKRAVEEWYDFIQTGKERVLEFDYSPGQE